MLLADIIAPLHNMQAPPHLILGPSEEIDPLQPHVRQAMVAGIGSRIIRHPSQSRHCLVLKQVPLEEGDEGSSAKAAVEEAVLRLRLFKEGGVNFDFGIIDKVDWYRHPNPGKTSDLRFFAVFFYVPWSHPGMPTLYELDDTDCEPLKGIFDRTSGRRLMDERAFRYFFRGYQEPYALDRFLRNAIALENLLVNDTRDITNVSYKFVDRGCFMLQQAKPHPNGPTGYVRPLREIYKTRSQVVHAASLSERTWPSDEERPTLLNSDQYLRLLLNFMIDHPEYGTAEAVDKAKRERYG